MLLLTALERLLDDKKQDEMRMSLTEGSLYLWCKQAISVSIFSISREQIILTYE